LAMSSRNVRLSKEQRTASPFIYQTLQKVESLFNKVTIEEVNTFVKNQFNATPLLELEYFTIAEEETLIEAKKINPTKNYRAFIAVNVSDIRLTIFLFKKQLESVFTIFNLLIHLKVLFLPHVSASSKI